MLISLIGESASGKTAIVKEIIKCGSVWIPLKFKKLRMRKAAGTDFFIFGVYNDGEEIFQGTDRLSMAVQPDVIEFLKRHSKKYPNARYLIEGGRLNNKSFYKALLKMGLIYQIICLTSGEENKKKRCVARGSNQTDRFKAAVKTKIENIRREESVELLKNDTEDDLAFNKNYILNILGLGNIF